MEIEGIKTYIWVGNSEVKETVMASGGAAEKLAGFVTFTQTVSGPDAGESGA